MMLTSAAAIAAALALWKGRRMKNG
jgi:hypothetical protein